MLTLQDCIAFSGLTDDQLEAVAHHEHVNIMLATELAECLLEKPNGCQILESILADEANQACKRRKACASRYVSGLEEFRRSYAARMRM